MLRESSATRVEASLAWRSLAIFSSLAVCAGVAPLDSVSLSAAGAAGAASFTSVCTRPAAWRSATPTSASGAAPARRLRKSLKSRLCAVIVWRASLALIVPACSAVGRSTTAPALIRLTLPPMNAFGLERSMATSIWSNDTLAGRLAAAMRPAVSPGCTRTCPPPPVPAGATLGACAARWGCTGAAGAGDAGRLTEGAGAACATGGIGALGTVGWARVEVGGELTPGATGAICGAGRRLGGSKRRV